MLHIEKLGTGPGDEATTKPDYSLILRPLLSFACCNETRQITSCIPYGRKFSRGSISRMGNLVAFRSSIFTDVHDHASTSSAHFVGLIFTVHESAMKTTKIGPLKNFPLYSNYLKLG